MSVLMRLGILALEWLTLLGACTVVGPYSLEERRDISQCAEEHQWEAWGISVRRLRDIPRGARARLWAC